MEQAVDYIYVTNLISYARRVPFHETSALARALSLFIR